MASLTKIKKALPVVVVVVGYVAPGNGKFAKI